MLVSTLIGNEYGQRDWTTVQKYADNYSHKIQHLSMVKSTFRFPV